MVSVETNPYPANPCHTTVDNLQKGVILNYGDHVQKDQLLLYVPPGHLLQPVLPEEIQNKTDSLEMLNSQLCSSPLV